MEPTGLDIGHARRPGSGSSRRLPRTGAEATRLQKLREIISLVNAGSDVGTIFDRIVFAVCHHTIWSFSGIMAVDRSTGYSVLVTYFEPYPTGRANLPKQWELATSPSLTVVETKRPVVIENAQLSEEFPGYRDDSRARGYRTVVVLPLGCTDFQGREMVLSVSSDKCVPVEADELDFLVTISHLAGLAVDKGKSLHGERMLSGRLERALEVNSSLLERVLHGSSMETIAGIVETVLPDPIVIVDLTNDAFHVNRSPDVASFGDREWAEFVRGPAARQLIQMMQRTMPSDFRHLQPVELGTDEAIWKSNAYIEPLLIDEEVVGGLVVFPRQRGLDKLDVLMAMEVKFALSVQLLRAHVQQQSQDYQVAELFARLFEGGWSDESQISNRAARLGLDLSVPAQFLAIEVGNGTRAAARGEGRPPVRSLRRHLSQFYPGSAIMHHVGTLIVYLPNPPQDLEMFTATIGRQVLDTVRWSCETKPVLALGPVCRRLEDYRGAREQCGRLLSLARLFGRQGVVCQEDFGPFAVLLSALDQHVALTFVDQTLGRIEAYDRENGTQLLRTAEAFIDQGCRYQATADYLEVHVSTLRYRMQRLNELFDLDLEDGEKRFSLALALRLRSLLGRIPRHDPP